MEIIRGVERRRRWSEAEKLQIVAEVEAPGAVFAQVARRHDISRGQLWKWRRQARSGELDGFGAVPSGFLPVCITPSPGQASPQTHVDIPLPPAPISPPDSQTAEIVLPDGICLRVNAGIETAALRRLLGVLRG